MVWHDHLEALAMSCAACTQESVFQNSQNSPEATQHSCNHRRQRQEDLEINVSLGCKIRSYQNKSQKGNHSQNTMV